MVRDLQKSMQPDCPLLVEVINFSVTDQNGSNVLYVVLINVLDAINMK